jgi:sodium-dependent phosphate cotransporter
MRQLVADRVERSLNAVLGSGGGTVAMLLGLVITVAVQSSSITTSIMIPLAAAGVVSLPNIYPVTLGANVGTTITALLAALAASKPEALTVGIVHTLFNLTGIALIYPVRQIRVLPIKAAERMADIAVERSGFAVVYVVGLFIIVPLLGVAILR